MALPLVLDVLLVFVLLSYLVYGLRTGLIRSLGAILGVLVGALAALLVVPVLGPLVPAQWRIAAVLIAAILLLAAGHGLGAAVGHALGRRIQRTALAPVDRVLGGLANVLVAAIVATTVASGLTTLGIPFLSQPIASSSVLNAVERATPDPVKSLLAQLRSVVVRDALPRLTEALGQPISQPDLPDDDIDSAALRKAAESVVRVTGTAFACGQGQSGTGFVVAEDRVLTNAHVLAGVAEPVVETMDDGAFAGTIVYFDPVHDLAVIAVEDLPTRALRAGDELVDGDVGAVAGYPYGGPFASNPAEVIARGEQPVADIYGDDPAPRDIYTLASDVQPGNSGGPLLDADGRVAGVVFAKAATSENVAFAMTEAEWGPVVDASSSLSAAVDSGSCSTR